jgi:hypothetical protein
MARSEAVAAMQAADNALVQLYWSTAFGEGTMEARHTVSEAHMKLFLAITALNKEDLESRTEQFKAAVEGAKFALKDLTSLAHDLEGIVKNTDRLLALVGTIGKAAMALEAL